MTANSPDASRPADAQKQIASEDAPVGTQRVFDAHVMQFRQDQVEPHISTRGRLYGAASIVGNIPTSDDTGHTLVDLNDIPPVTFEWVDGEAGSANFNQDGVLDAGWEYDYGSGVSAFDGFQVVDGILYWNWDNGEGVDPGTAAAGNASATGFNTARVQTDIPVGDFECWASIANNPQQYFTGGFTGYGFCLHDGNVSHSARFEVFINFGATSSQNDTPTAYVNVNGSAVTAVNPALPGGINRGYPPLFKLSRVGTTYSFDVSWDGGETLVNICSTDQPAFAPTKIGLYNYQIGSPSGVPMRGGINFIQFGTLKLPNILYDARTTLKTLQFNDLTELEQNNTGGATLSIPQAGRLLMDKSAGAAGSRAGFAVANIACPYNCGMAWDYTGVNIGINAYLGAQIRAASLNGVDWTEHYGPPIGWVAEARNRDNLQRAITINNDKPAQSDGGRWNFHAQGNFGPDPGPNWVRVRMEAIGPYFRMKSWDRSLQEPAAWDFELFDDSIRPTELHGEAMKFGLAYASNDGVTENASIYVENMEVYKIGV